MVGDDRYAHHYMCDSKYGAPAEKRKQPQKEKKFLLALRAATKSNDRAKCVCIYIILLTNDDDNDSQILSSSYAGAHLAFHDNCHGKL